MSLETMFSGVFSSGSSAAIELPKFLLCVGVSLVIGLLIAVCYMIKSRYTKSFVVTLATLPAVVCMVIMMVNGNLGAGVAVAGTFSLVRFRSVPGTAREIGAIFLAMGAGLATGMGYLGYAALFTVILSGVSVIYTFSRVGEMDSARRTMKITIPEDLNYTDVFDDIFRKYTRAAELAGVRTSGMGSLFKLTYDLTLVDPSTEKAFIDELRCRNGNLEIVLTRPAGMTAEL